MLTVVADVARAVPVVAGGALVLVLVVAVVVVPLSLGRKKQQ